MFRTTSTRLFAQMFVSTISWDQWAIGPNFKLFIIYSWLLRDHRKEEPVVVLIIILSKPLSQRPSPSSLPTPRRWRSDRGWKQSDHRATSLIPPARFPRKDKRRTITLWSVICWLGLFGSLNRIPFPPNRRTPIEGSEIELNNSTLPMYSIFVYRLLRHRSIHSTLNSLLIINYSLTVIIMFIYDLSTIYRLITNYGGVCAFSVNTTTGKSRVKRK